MCVCVRAWAKDKQRTAWAHSLTHMHIWYVCMCTSLSKGQTKKCMDPLTHSHAYMHVYILIDSHLLHRLKSITDSLLVLWLCDRCCHKKLARWLDVCAEIYTRPQHRHSLKRSRYTLCTIRPRQGSKQTRRNIRLTYTVLTSLTAGNSRGKSHCPC